MPHGRFLFVDETGVNLDLGRTHARAPRGQRAVDKSVPAQHAHPHRARWAR